MDMNHCDMQNQIGRNGGHVVYCGSKFKEGFNQENTTEIFRTRNGNCALHEGALYYEIFIFIPMNTQEGLFYNSFFTERKTFCAKI